jgi:carbamoyltransferase
MQAPTAILGINTRQGDAAAALMVDGRLVAAAEERRFGLRDSGAGFPGAAVRFCLEQAGLQGADLTHLATNRDPRSPLWRELGGALRGRTAPAELLGRIGSRRAQRDLCAQVALSLGLPASALRVELREVGHQRAHLASAFLVSPFASAAVATLDGLGDPASGVWGHGQGSRITLLGRARYPHSLGLFYRALSQFLGFHGRDAESKLMALAVHGKPLHLDALRRVVGPVDDGVFRLELRYFANHRRAFGTRRSAVDSRTPRLWSEELEQLLGPPRLPGEPLRERHCDLAASVQALYEERLFELLSDLHRRTGENALCLAGGGASNALANGRIIRNTPFDEVHVAPAPAEAGGAIGAAAAVWCEDLGRRRDFAMEHAFWGPAIDTAGLDGWLAGAADALRAQDCRGERVVDEDVLCARVAQALAAGKLVGWYQGRMEWGARALGNRSLLADPRRAELRDRIALALGCDEPGPVRGHQQEFRPGHVQSRLRPFGCSVLRERTGACRFARRSAATCRPWRRPTAARSCRPSSVRPTAASGS